MKRYFLKFIGCLMLLMIIFKTNVSQSNTVLEKKEHNQQSTEKSNEKEGLISQQKKDSNSITYSPFNSEKNVQQIMEYQTKQNKKQKQQALVRIGIGLGFLAILIFGLLRKRKIKQ